MVLEGHRDNTSPADTPRRKRIHWAWAAPCALVLGEWGLRLRHLWSALQLPDDDLREESRRERRTEPCPGQLRIVALGDSITHGMGLLPEETYPAILERRLREYLGSDRTVVLNAGVAGNTVLLALRRLERDVIAFQPRITLVAFGLNDANLCRRPQDALLEAEIFPRGVARLARQSHLLLTGEVWLKRLAEIVGLRQPIHWDAPPELRPRVSPPAFRAGLIALVQRVRFYTQSQIILLTTPPARPAGIDPALLSYQQALLKNYNAIIRSVARRWKTGLIDVERAFNAADTARFFEPDGVHIAAEGQAFLTDIILDGLLQSGFLDAVVLGLPEFALG